MFNVRLGARVGFLSGLFAVATTCQALADDSRSYVAAYELQTPSGVEKASETLSVRHEHTTSFVSVSSANGALVSLPTQFAADGEIIANSFDPSVTCYNMAAAALYSSEHAPAQPAPVYVRMGENTVTVPLTFTAAVATNGDRMLVGSGATAFTLTNDTTQISAGMVVDARIGIARGELSEVVFNEATLMGSPARPVSRMTCSLRKASAPAPLTVAPAVPAVPVSVLPS